MFMCMCEEHKASSKKYTEVCTCLRNSQQPVSFVDWQGMFAINGSPFCQGGLDFASSTG